VTGYETRVRAQLCILLDRYGEAYALREALNDGMVDGAIFWNHEDQQGCPLAIVLAAHGDEDPAHAAFTLHGFESLEGWAQHIKPSDLPDLLAEEVSGPYRAAMLVQWINEWEAERVSA
jgi:hypothetical protein